MSSLDLILTLDELVDFILSEENHSDGFAYVRGLASTLGGGEPSEQQVALTFYMLNWWDQELRHLIVQVAAVNTSSPHIITKELLKRISVIYARSNRR